VTTISLELVNKLLFEYDNNPFFTVKHFHAALEASLVPPPHKVETSALWLCKTCFEPVQAKRVSLNHEIWVHRDSSMDVEPETAKERVARAKREIREREAAENRQIFNDVVDNLPEKD